MGVVEQNIALVTKDNKNNTVLQYPLTTLNQVEGLEESLNKCISKNPTVIPREADLNTILETGYYCCAANDTAKTIKNCPIQEAFYLEVVKNQESSNSSQIYTEFKQILTSFNINNPKTFIRTIHNTGNILFGAWQEFVFSQNAIKSITANNNVLTYTTANAKTQTVTIDNVPNATHAQSSGKLTNPRSISVGGAVKSNAVNFDGTQNITILANTIYEPFIDYGYSHITGRTSPIDNAMSALHSANRFQFAMPSGITIEYSTDGGKTWLDYGASDTSKMKLVCDLGDSFYIGKRTSKNTINDKLRITLNASKMGVYTRFRKILLNISTNYAAGSNVTIERSLKGTPTVFTKYGEGSIPISGWSGWNSLNMGGIPFGGSVGQNSNYECIRLTFGITGVNSDSSKSSALAINNILGFGDTYWATPSTMAKTGNIYTYDVNQNVGFPANVSAKLFDGLATKAQKDSREQVIDSTYIKGLSANGRTITITKGNGTTSTITTQDTNTTYSPASSSVLGLVKTGTNITNNSGTISITKSNVVNALGYTPPTVNTTYNVATQTTNGLMSANDKKKLDTIKYQSGRNASMWR